ncbi:MAG: ribonuclease H family protein [Bacteroidales bacterium]|jgi:ribonuclease HI|nr:ribonuclease H family protein [Bacteroidales bacterium]
MKKNKYYVVWNGHTPGIYASWEECKMQVEAFANAHYRGMPSREEAEEAFAKTYDEYLEYLTTKESLQKLVLHKNKDIVRESIAVDAACSGNPGRMEYRGLYLKTNTELFRVGPLEEGTNNIGEFLAIVHALAFLKQKNMNLPVYSDSENALLWVRNKKCKTKLKASEKNKPVFALIARAEKWLNENTYSCRIVKWQTKEWGEIPADFGNKRKDKQ